MNFIGLPNIIIIFFYLIYFLQNILFFLQIWQVESLLKFFFQLLSFLLTIFLFLFLPLVLLLSLLYFLFFLLEVLLNPHPVLLFLFFHFLFLCFLQLKESIFFPLYLLLRLFKISHFFLVQFLLFLFLGFSVKKLPSFVVFISFLPFFPQGLNFKFNRISSLFPINFLSLPLSRQPNDLSSLPPHKLIDNFLSSFFDDWTLIFHSIENILHTISHLFSDGFIFNAGLCYSKFNSQWKVDKWLKLFICLRWRRKVDGFFISISSWNRSLRLEVSFAIIFHLLIDVLKQKRFCQKSLWFYAEWLNHMKTKFRMLWKNHVNHFQNFDIWRTNIFLKHRMKIVLEFQRGLLYFFVSLR